MDAVGDQAGMHGLAIQHRAHDARLAIAELAHGIEQMRGHAGPGIEGGHGLFVAGVGMADADNGASSGEPGDLFGRHRLGGHGAKQVGQRCSRSAKALEIGLIHRTDERRIMRALAGQSQMRPFQMQADKAGHARIGCRHACGDGLDIDLGRVGDQRGQQGGGAELRMSRADGADGIKRRGIVEQHPAATIDLQVDEAGHNHAAIELQALGMVRNFRPGNDAGDIAELDQQRRIVGPALAIKDAGA